MLPSAKDYRYDFPVHSKAKDSVVITGDKWRFQILGDGLLRYEWADDGVFEDRASTFAINRDLPEPKFRKWEEDGYLNVKTKFYHIIYNKQEFSPSSFLVRIGGGVTRHHSEWRYGDTAHGFGGTTRTLDGVDGRIELGPGVVSPNGYSVIDDSTTMLFEDGWIAPRRKGPNRVDGYLFAYAHNYKEAIKALYAISGPQPLLPRWSLGNWWSRYHAYSADEYLTLMDKFKAEDIPFNVAVIDMDWHWVDDQRVIDAGMSGWTGYSWNLNLFKDPKKFCQELKNRNLKITINDHPADGVASYEDAYKRMAKALNFDTSDKATIDFDPTSRKFLDAYFDVLLRDLEDDGIDFFWEDWQSGPFSRVEGIDPLTILNHYHYLNNKTHSVETPLVFSRYAGPGSHRYPVGFSGDTVTTWKSLEFQPEFTATASNIGYGQWSHDIGGHMFGYRDDELTARWVQLGVFSPIMRLHSTNSQWMSKEPWLYGIETETSMKSMLRFRHRLIPYLHTMNIRASKEGEQLIQPMYWHWSERAEAGKYKNQFYFGTELLVSPIVSPRHPDTRLGSVQTWLPPGRYVDMFSGTVHDGNRIISIHRAVDKIPVFAKEGSIIPLDKDEVPGTGAFNPERIEILLVVGQDGEFTLREDSPDTGIGGVEFKISYNQEKGSLTILPAKSASPEKRTWWIRLLAFDHAAASKFSINNQNLEASAITVDDTSTILSLGSHPTSNRIEVSLGHNPQLRISNPLPRIESMMMRFQTEFELKRKIWDILTQAGVSIAGKVLQLNSLDMSESIRGAVMEAFLADDRVDLETLQLEKHAWSGRWD